LTPTPILVTASDKDVLQKAKERAKCSVHVLL
jgi:hypothetical protein